MRFKTADDYLNYLKEDHYVGGPRSFELDQYDEQRVQLLPLASVARGLFVPHPQRERVYFAHPVTIRAIRADLFVAGHDLDYFTEIAHCRSCGQELDLQYWRFCPFCEAHLHESDKE